MVRVSRGAARRANERGRETVVERERTEKSKDTTTVDISIFFSF